MTGYRSSYFRHDCQTRGCYITSLPSWDDLIECFPRGIRPTDVDGLVEINGHVLVLEEKRAGQGPDNGQRIALRTLSRLPQVTVLYVRPGDASEMEVLLLDGLSEPRGWTPMSRAQLYEWLRWWSHEADCVVQSSA